MRNSNGRVHSVWKSPVPYLLGGVGAMLALIAFALFILACSYWNSSAHHDHSSNSNNHNNNNNNAGGSAENGGPDHKLGNADDCAEERVAVIMAGDEEPTVLAKPTDVSACMNVSP
eukprot:Gb_30729 [translate_table: standard]